MGTHYILFHREIRKIVGFFVLFFSAKKYTLSRAMEFATMLVWDISNEKVSQNNQNAHILIIFLICSLIRALTVHLAVSRDSVSGH